MSHTGRNDRSKLLLTSRLLPLAIALGSGLVMGLAPAPLNWFPLAWLALMPLWVLLFEPESFNLNSPKQEQSKRSLRRLPFAVYLSLAWGLGYHGLALAWITGLHPLTWLGVPWLASVAIVFFCWGFITLWGAVLVATWAWLLVKLTGQKTGQKEAERHGEAKANAIVTTVSRLLPVGLWLSLRRVLLGTALWCGLEWLWSLGPLDWTALAYTQSPGNLVALHLGQISGTSGVTAAIMTVNGLLAEAWMGGWGRGERGEGRGERGEGRGERGEGRGERGEGRGERGRRLSVWILVTLAGVVLVTAHCIGYVFYVQPIDAPEAAALKIGLVQGNVPTRIKLGREGIQRATDGYTKGYQALADQGVDAVLTPEGALPFLWNEPNKRSSPLYQAVLEKGVVLWLGTFTAQKGGIARSLLTIAPDGNTLSRYDKIKLVPLGEYMPFQNFLGGISILSTITENGVPGGFQQQVDTPFGRAIASICYDSAFPEVFRTQAAAGGQFILTAANLDPYSEVLMAQHQAQDIMRAIETDRWAVRATNTGYSSVINPHGGVEWRSQPRTYQIHAATIFRRHTQTLYVRWGNWLTLLLLGLGAIVSLLQTRPLA